MGRVDLNACRPKSKPYRPIYKTAQATSSHIWFGSTRHNLHDPYSKAVHPYNESEKTVYTLLEVVQTMLYPLREEETNANAYSWQAHIQDGVRSRIGQVWFLHDWSQRWQSQRRKWTVSPKMTAGPLDLSFSHRRDIEGMYWVIALLSISKFPLQRISLAGIGLDI